MDQNVALLVVWLCMALAIRLAATPVACEDDWCRQTHQTHIERERRRRVTRLHAEHDRPEPDCDECERAHRP